MKNCSPLASLRGLRNRVPIQIILRSFKYVPGNSLSQNKSSLRCYCFAASSSYMYKQIFGINKELKTGSNSSFIFKLQTCSWWACIWHTNATSHGIGTSWISFQCISLPPLLLHSFLLPLSHAHANTSIYTHTHAHTSIHTHTHTHPPTHTCTHKHTQIIPHISWRLIQKKFWRNV